MKVKLAATVVVVAGAAVAGAFLLERLGSPEVRARTFETLSPVYTVDREYRSMVGPQSTQAVLLPGSEAAELIWITGYRAVMVGPDGKTPMSQEFMCHSNLDFDNQRHSALHKVPIYHTGRLFTLSQGQFEISFPPGFGLPFYSDEEFSLTTQVLNLNPDGRTHEVRHRVSIDYVREADLEEPMKPLFMTSGWGLVLLEGEEGYFGVESPSAEEHGEGCLPGSTAGTDNYSDEFGRRFSGHWVVEPGRQENRTLVTEIMDVPYDTTLHYIAVHLHPFAESLELVDLTDGKSLFKSKVDGSAGKIGIDRVEYFSSEEGIPVYEDHEYELTSVYNNTTSENQDSMAVMLLYLLDKKFTQRERIRPTHVASATPGPEQIELRTNHGDITIGLYPDVAPRHVARVLELARNGVYDTTGFFRVEPGFLIQTGYPHNRTGPPLTPRQSVLLRPLTAELSDIKHRRGVVSMVPNRADDPNSAEASFMILLGDAPALDGNYTVFGRVVDGFETLDAIAAVPRQGSTPVEPVEIQKAVVSSAVSRL